MNSCTEEFQEYIIEVYEYIVEFKEYVTEVYEALR